MLFTVAQPLTLMTEDNEVLGSFVGLATLDCAESPKRLTRGGNAINAEQYCLFQRLCLLHFSALVSYQTIFVAANSTDVAHQFIWAQMTIGKHGYTGCTKLPVHNLRDGFSKATPYNFVIHEVGNEQSIINVCNIKFPYGSLADGVCTFSSIPANTLKKYMESLESLTVSLPMHLPKTIVKGIKIGDTTHSLVPFEISVTTEAGVSRYLCVNARSKDKNYFDELILGALRTYLDCINGMENDKLEEAAFKYGCTAMGYCLAVYLQVGVFLVPITSQAKFSFDLTKPA